MIKHQVVVFDGIPDINPGKFYHKFEAETLFVHDCDKNFVYYYANHSHFPKLKSIYLMSHPCMPYVLRQNMEHIYLATNYRRYKDQWAYDLDNVQLRTYDEMKYIMDEALTAISH
jgi:hypothetical protein